MKQGILFLALATISSCNESSETTTSPIPANVDSLTTAFVLGWNNKDSAAIMEQMADNAIVMNDSLIHNGRSAIADKWVSGGVKVISNVRTSSLSKGSDATMAYDGGTYTSDLTPPGGPVLKERGNYSVVWTKQDNGNWKLTLVHIEDVSAMPDVQ